MKSILEQLSSMTVVVADTGDLDSIKKFQPRDATTNPSLILAAAKNPDYVKLIDKALESSENALPQGFSEIELIKETVDQVSVCLLYTSPSPRDQSGSRMPSSA